jgi:Dynein heavy chain C-terminal domain
VRYCTELTLLYCAVCYVTVHCILYTVYCTTLECTVLHCNVPYTIVQHCKCLCSLYVPVVHRTSATGNTNSFPLPATHHTTHTTHTIGSWVSHFTRRHEQYELWINKGEPVCVWLSGLHIPESYLTALVQSTCRMRSWPLDKSTLYTVVTKHTSDKDLVRLESGEKDEIGSCSGFILSFSFLSCFSPFFFVLFSRLLLILYTFSPPSLTHPSSIVPHSLLNSTTPCTLLTPGCYVSGLYLEGAAWSDELGCLVGQDPKVLVVELPIMQIIPVETSKLKLHNTFRTPGLSFTFSVLYHLNILILISLSSR